MNSEKIESHRLIIRPFIDNDLLVIHRILDRPFGDGTKDHDQTALEERRMWLQWQILNQEWLPKTDQPPLGEQAIVLKATRNVIGSTGLVPYIEPFEQIPEFRTLTAPSGYNTIEVGIFWVIDPKHQRQGYATEAAKALIAFAFKQLRLKRIIAITAYSNLASQGVMQKVGMTLTRNPLPDPPLLQIVGVLKNTA